MEILFLLVGLPFVAVGIAIVVSEARARRGAWAVPGQVIGFSFGAAHRVDARSFYSVAEYVGPDGRTRYVEASVGSSSPLGTVGDAVTVLAQPDDPEKATIRSSLSYVVGIVIALMGLVSCAVFFAVFRITTFSVAGAVAVTAIAAYKLRGAIREKPMSLQAWREYKGKLLRPRVFTEASKGEISWVDPAAVQEAIRSQQRANRFAVPFFLLAGVGLLFLGFHLHRTTEAFLERAVRAPGQVVELVASDSSENVTYAPVVEFEVRDHTYTFKDSVASNPPSYRRGDAVAVLYDPGNPRDARIDRGRWNRAVPVLVGAAGAFFLFCGVWLMKRQSEARERAAAFG